MDPSQQQQQQQQQPASAPARMAPQDTSAWLARIASVQREKASPEQLEQMRARSEAMRRSAVKAKKASRIHQSMSLSSSAWSSGVQAVTASPASRSAAIRAQSLDAMAMMSSPAMLSPMPSAPGASLEEEEAAEEALELQMQLAVRQQVAEGALDISDAAAAATPAGRGDAAAAAQQAASLEEALKQLETEPADSAACAAKFELYEGFAKLTEDARAATLALWAQSAEDFEAAPAAKAQIERDIQRVDRHENLGIHDDPRRWFVHGMCCVAAKNQKALNGVLGGITTKLELLASQTECPICFDEFGPERPATTLGCAHKACEECWTHWARVGGGICPLCRHEEFLHRVMSGAADA